MNTIKEWLRKKLFDKELKKLKDREEELLKKTVHNAFYGDNNYIENVTKTLENHNKILKELAKPFISEHETLTVSYAGCADIEENIPKDCFTKEFINKDAINTQKITIIDGNNIEEGYYKEGNEKGFDTVIREGKEYYIK